VSTAFITTVTDRCRMCYTCVRECPVKAIRITEGQAKVIGDRCIACGNCIRV
jgi:dissimilatory sulfite reductase (desulfoviridin) alpha/beta subunit